MIKPERQAELLEEAKRVDGIFGAARVVRSDVAPLVQRYVSGREPSDQRLQIALHLSKTLPTSWMVLRGGVGDRLPLVCEQLKKIFEAGYAEEELRFLLGWILRLTTIRNQDQSPDE